MKIVRALNAAFRAREKNARFSLRGADLILSRAACKAARVEGWPTVRRLAMLRDAQGVALRSSA
jgi:hypothetical protein